MAKAKSTKAWLIAGIVAISAAIVGLSAKVASLETTKTVNATWGWEQGLLDTTPGEDTLGKEVKGKTAIRMKDSVTLEGFEIDIKDDASVTYQLFFLDADEVCVGVSDAGMSIDYVAADANVPETAVKVRAVVTPNNDPEVSVYEIAAYASELTISYNK